MKYLNNQTVLITGGVGTVGEELIRQIFQHNPKEIRVVDNNEEGVFFLEEKLRAGRDNAPGFVYGDGICTPSTESFAP